MHYVYSELNYKGNDRSTLSGSIFLFISANVKELVLASYFNREIVWFCFSLSHYDTMKSTDLFSKPPTQLCRGIIDIIIQTSRTG